MLLIRFPVCNKDEVTNIRGEVQYMLILVMARVPGDYICVLVWSNPFNRSLITALCIFIRIIVVRNLNTHEVYFD